MKYLKSFKESVDSNIIQDVKEILLEFSDSGNDIKVDWVDSRYKDEVVVIIKNNTQELDVDTFVRLFSYMKGLDFKCNYINCGYPVNEKQFDASDKIYISQQDKDFNFYSDSTTKEGIDQVNSWKALELVFHKMKMQNFSEFKVNESFSLSKELSIFISKNSINWSDFTDSLIEVKDIKGVDIKRWVYVIDDKGHVINVDLEDGVDYKFNYLIRISYSFKKKSSIGDFYKSQENLNTISISIQEMIDRASEVAKFKSSEYEIDYISSEDLVRYQFEIEFTSDINLDELKKYYKDYKSSGFNTPEFNAGMKEIISYYKRRNIEPSEYLDTADAEDYILIGFLTDDDLYGIAQYNTKTKKFTIDYNEIDNSIDYLNEIE